MSLKFQDKARSEEIISLKVTHESFGADDRTCFKRFSESLSNDFVWACIKAFKERVCQVPYRRLIRMHGLQGASWGNSQALEVLGSKKATQYYKKGCGLSEVCSNTCL
jgi:hypothetical protein